MYILQPSHEGWHKTIFLLWKKGLSAKHQFRKGTMRWLRITDSKNAVIIWNTLL
jgi:hypothetical protein